jgi:hypothetical protein
VVAYAVLSTPDDGCKEQLKHVERSCSAIKYRLQTAASRWKLIYITSEMLVEGARTLTAHEKILQHEIG